MGELVTSHILPSAIRYQNVLSSNVRGLKDAGVKSTVYANQIELLEKISEHINKATESVEKMIEARKKCNKLDNTREKAIAYQTKVKDAYFDEIRYHVDKLELFVDDREWTLPKYREMLFLR
jgi:glutamine synthetase